jgi:hypothetical protein
VEIAFAPATPGLAVALSTPMAGRAVVGRMHVSTNSGATWAFNSQPGHMSVQGFWNNAVVGGPVRFEAHRRRRHRYLPRRGCGELWLANSPVAWTKISQWFTSASVHADNHAIVPGEQLQRHDQSRRLHRR